MAYNCTSGYPVPFEDVCMLEIRYLHETYKDRVKLIGFSGHHLGIAIGIAAFALGATWVERHFTKDRTWKGTDHAASLEPAGLEKLCRDLQATYKCMTYKEEDILPIEAEQRAKLKWGCYNADSKGQKRAADGSPKKATSPTTSKEPKSPKSPKSPKPTSPKKTKA